MQKLHVFIKRLSGDVTNSIDDISRYISMQYMKKKSNELRLRKQMSMAAPAAQPMQNQPMQPMQPMRPMQGNGPMPPMNPGRANMLMRMGRSLSNGHLDHDDDLNSDLFNSHPVIHNYGKIENKEKNFESLKQQSNESNTSIEKNSGQNYQPL